MRADQTAESRRVKISHVVDGIPWSSVLQIWSAGLQSECIAGAGESPILTLF